VPGVVLRATKRRERGRQGGGRGIFLKKDTLPRNSLVLGESKYIGVSI